jgi:hypothetical protein
MPMPLADAHTPPSYPRRFGWPMRLFLTAFVFLITFRSLASLVPFGEWSKRLDVDRRPARLPPRAQRDTESVMRAFDSVWEFARPWPGPDSRARIHSWPDGGRFALCWLDSRLTFVENLLAVNQGWPMFSPNAVRHVEHVRARLLYADGTDRVVRQRAAEPDDLTRYARWNKEKVLDYETRVDADDDDACLGYCNLLAHRYARNPSGAVLETIVLYQVVYDLAPPGVDARAHYEEQQRLTQDPPRLPGSARTDPARRARQVLDDFYEYDVATQVGKNLKEP